MMADPLPIPAAAWTTIILAIAMAGGCARENSLPPIPPGDPDRGQALVARFECGTCHVVPGIRGARGQVGPPLHNYARRVYLAGKFPNSPEMLIRWLKDPPALAPETAMPKLTITDEQARDMASYLFGLR